MGTASFRLEEPIARVGILSCCSQGRPQHQNSSAFFHLLDKSEEPLK